MPVGLKEETSLEDESTTDPTLTVFCRFGWSVSQSAWPTDPVWEPLPVEDTAQFLQQK